MFYAFQKNHPHIEAAKIEASMRERDALLFSQEDFEERLAHEKRMFAVNWLMIPFTRSIDHLVVHLTDDKSELGETLKIVSKNFPGSIEWL